MSVDSSHPIIQLVTWRPKEVKGLAPGSRKVRNSWNSNSQEGLQASTPNHCDPSPRIKVGHEDKVRKKAGMFQRPRTGPPSFTQASLPPLISESSSSSPCSAQGFPAHPPTGPLANAANGESLYQLSPPLTLPSLLALSATGIA